MRRGLFLLLIAGWLLAPNAFSSEARIVKVLVHYLDAQGRQSLSPSLYERDAYQARLRQNPGERKALRLDVQWKGRNPEAQLKVKAELRGVRGNLIESRALEQTLRPSRWLAAWSSVALEGEAYQLFGELVAWRVTLWDGDQLLGEQKSFLW